MIDSLASYISDKGRLAQLADATGADPQWLYQVATAWRGKRASYALAQAIERATDGAVTRQDLRPDIWPPEEKEARDAA